MSDTAILAAKNLGNLVPRRPGGFMAYAHLAAGAVRVRMHLGRETKTARPPPLAQVPIFLVALLTVPGEATNLRFLAEARFCAHTEMIQNEDTMGHFCGAGRSPSNLAGPPNATCCTRNSDDAEEMMPANCVSVAVQVRI